MEKTTQDDKVITYTDFVGTLMSSVTDIVNVISYVLVAFVGISSGCFFDYDWCYYLYKCFRT